MTTLLRLALVAVLVAPSGCDDATSNGPVVSKSSPLTADTSPEHAERSVEKPNDTTKTVTCKPIMELLDDQRFIADSEGNMSTSGLENWLVLDDNGNSIRFLLDVWPPSGRVRQAARELARLREDREYEFTLETLDDSSVVLTRVTDGQEIIFEGRLGGHR